MLTKRPKFNDHRQRKTQECKHTQNNKRMNMIAERLDYFCKKMFETERNKTSKHKRLTIRAYKEIHCFQPFTCSLEASMTNSEYKKVQK